jgi:tripartite-type tricarboxylate transporter receptor subunit TctC
MFDTLAALPHIESGRVRALGVTGPQRHPLLPDVPAIAETIPDYLVVAWFGVFAPAGLPPTIATAMNHAVTAALREQDVGEKLRALGFEPSPGSAENLAEQIARDNALWGPVIRAAGLRPE